MIRIKNLKKYSLWFLVVLIISSSFVSCKISKIYNLEQKHLTAHTSFEKMKYGLFVHYVPGLTVFQDGKPCNDLNELANLFDVNAFADDLVAMKVEYVIFTAWHADMNLPYPSDKMNSWRPGHSTKRDMIGDMINAVKSKGIKIYLYTMPRDGHEFKNDKEKEETGWGAGRNHKDGWNPNWETFNYLKWNNFINDIYGELIDRYGNDIDGLFLDEGSPAGDSYRVIDYNRLRKTIKTRNPNLTMIQNFYGTNYSCDIGMKEYGRGWGEFAQSNGNKWPAYTIPVLSVIGGNWMAVNPLGKNNVLFTAADLFRYTALEAGANTNGGGGVVWAAGPYAGKGWESGVLDTLIKVGQFIEPISISIKQTLPSSSYPTVSGNTISDLNWGVATQSLDGRTEFIHVLNPPKGKKLIISVPEDGKQFGSATLVRNGHKISLKQNANGVELTLPNGEVWDAYNTVIQLTVTGTVPVKSVYRWINDTDNDISYEGRGWEYSRWERNHGDYDDDIHFTSQKDDFLLFPFTGTGIEYITSRSKEQGKCDIFLDGIYQTTVDAYSSNYQAQQVLFRKTKLVNEKHLLKIINKENNSLHLDVFKLYSR